MKPWLPYNILVVLAIGACGLLVLYNVALQEPFSVVVGYQYPQPSAAPAQTKVTGESGPEMFLASEEILEEPEWEEEPVGEVSTALTSVVFPLELNAASLEELQFIPGVGEVLSQRIVQYRELLGGYNSLEQLQEIKGIGGQTYAKISAYLYLSGGERTAQGEEAEDEEAA